MTLSNWRLTSNGRQLVVTLTDPNGFTGNLMVAYVRRNGALEKLWDHPIVPDEARLALIVAALRAEGATRP